MEINIENAKNAIKSYLKNLDSLEVITNFSIGEDKALELVKLNGINLNLDEIFNDSKEFFKEHDLKIVELVKKIKIKYSLDKNKSERDVLEFIKEKFSIPISDVVKQYKKDQEKIEKEQNQLISRIDILSNVTILS